MYPLLSVSVALVFRNRLLAFRLLITSSYILYKRARAMMFRALFRCQTCLCVGLSLTIITLGILRSALGESVGKPMELWVLLSYITKVLWWTSRSGVVWRRWVPSGDLWRCWRYGVVKRHCRLSVDLSFLASMMKNSVMARRQTAVPGP